MQAVALDEAAVQKLIRDEVAAAFAEKERRDAERPKKMALIATRGTLDWAYPPLILATSAAAM